MLTIDGRNDLPLLPQNTSTLVSLNQAINGIMTTTPAAPTQASALQKSTRSSRHMWIVTGPAGCGKSTVAAYLAQELGVPFIEGDDVSYTGLQPQYSKPGSHSLCGTRTGETFISSSILLPQS